MAGSGVSIYDQIFELQNALASSFFHVWLISSYAVSIIVDAAWSTCMKNKLHTIC